MNSHPGRFLVESEPRPHLARPVACITAEPDDDPLDALRATSPYTLSPDILDAVALDDDTAPGDDWDFSTPLYDDTSPNPRHWSPEKKRATCGELWHTMSSGVPRWYYYRCKDYTGCRRCQSERATELRLDLAIPLAVHDQLQALVIKEADKDRFLRAVKSADAYMAIPVGDDERVIFLTAEGAHNARHMIRRMELTSTLLTLDNMDTAVDWAQLAARPQDKSRRASGKLALPYRAEKAEKPERTPEEKAETVRVPTLRSNAAGDVERRIWRQVIERTASLNPQNAQAVQDAINLRVEGFKQAMGSEGYVVREVMWKKVLLCDNRDWLATTARFLNVPLASIIPAPPMRAEDLVEVEPREEVDYAPEYVECVKREDTGDE